jgi:hypothetical protein
MSRSEDYLARAELAEGRARYMSGAVRDQFLQVALEWRRMAGKAAAEERAQKDVS